MARVTYGAIITELAGSIGSATFHRNVSGSIYKSKPISKTLRSASQIANQLIVSNVNYLWSLLSDSDKESWKTFAADYPFTSPSGVEKTLSGYQYFMSCNSNLLLTGNSTISTAPVFVSVPDFPVIEIFTDIDYFKVFWDGFYSLADTYTIVTASCPIRQSNVNNLQYNRFMKAVNNFEIEEIDFTSEYCARFNLIWADFFTYSECFVNVSCRAIEINTGLSSKLSSVIYHNSPIPV